MSPPGQPVSAEASSCYHQGLPAEMEVESGGQGASSSVSMHPAHCTPMESLPWHQGWTQPTWTSMTQLN